MDYISATKAAKKWGVSSALVRKYCRDNRVPNARFRDGAWQIPEDAKNRNRWWTLSLCLSYHHWPLS